MIDSHSVLHTHWGNNSTSVNISFFSSSCSFLFLCFIHCSLFGQSFIHRCQTQSSPAQTVASEHERLFGSGATFVRLLLFLFYPLLNFLFTSFLISGFILYPSIYYSIYCFTIFNLPLHKLQILFYTPLLSIHSPNSLVNLLFYPLLNF